MAEKRGKSNIRSYLLPVALLLALAAGGAMLWPVYRAKQKKQAELLRLQQIVAEKKAERNTRAQQTEALKNSPAAVEKIAREKYRFAREGETILQYPAPPEKRSKTKPVQ
jgi:cell division protein FtsB